jgi:cyclic pyranopterin phosphate synthase
MTAHDTQNEGRIDSSPEARRNAIEDEHGRSFRTLRVSLTNACNFGCVYCVNGEDKGGINAPGAGAAEHLPYAALAEIVVALHTMLDLKTIRLTGGEPTLYADLIPFVETLTANGIGNIKMTTNGFLLKQKAAALRAAGVKECNVSLDAVEPAAFAAIAKRSLLPQVLEGIDAALACGLDVKLNAVIMRGMNEHQILPLLDFAVARKMELRYLELMRMGHFYSKNFDTYFYPMSEIRGTIETVHTLTALHRGPSATAQRWRMEDGSTFGIIANESEPFCSDCDRLRLDSFGNIYGCLSDEKREYIADSVHNDKALAERLQLALTHKQPLKFKGSPLTMISIGG